MEFAWHGLATDEKKTAVEFVKTIVDSFYSWN
jgi:hypothetical protein